jgi:hypothetical protein
VADDDWQEMQPDPIRVRATERPDVWEVLMPDGTVEWWSRSSFAHRGLTPPEPPPAPIVLDGVEFSREGAEAFVEMWGHGHDDVLGGPAGQDCIRVAAALREQMEAQ